MIAAGCCALADPDTRSAPTEAMLAADRQYQEELHLEANAPGMPRQDLRRTTAAVAQVEQGKEKEIAAYARDRVAQQLALLEASPSQFVFWNPEVDAEEVGTAPRGTLRGAGRYPLGTSRSLLGSVATTGYHGLGRWSRNTATVQTVLSADKEMAYQAGLRAEAKAPGIPALDLRRVSTMMASVKQQGEKTIASNAKYQIALAGSLRGGQRWKPAQSATYIRTSIETPVSGSRKVSGIGGVISDKALARSVRDEGARQIARDSAEQQAASEQQAPAGKAKAAAEQEKQSQPAMSNDSGIPFGTPVHGRPGFVTSPFSKSGGFIDVGGYPSGTKLLDPYTGRTFLVP